MLAAALPPDAALKTFADASARIDPEAVRFTAFQIEEPLFLIGANLAGLDDIARYRRDRLIMRAVGDMYKAGTEAVEDFLAAISAQVAGLTCNSRTKYTVAISLDAAAIHCWLLPGVVLGTRLESASFSDVQALAGEVNLLEISEWQSAEVRANQLRDFPFVLATVEALDYMDAFDKVSLPYEALRASLNWHACRGDIWYCGRPKARGKHHPAAVYVSTSEVGDVQGAYGIHVGPFERPTIEDSSEKSVSFLLDEF